MSFQNNVLMIAIVIFIFIMLIVAAMMRNATGTQAFPPQIGACPDYWQLLLDGRCQNVQGLGSNCQSPVDFNTPQFTGDKGATARCKFAKGCDIEWDGITNSERVDCS